MKIDIHALKELRELYFFIMIQYTFRCPYSDLESQDYGSLLNENYSVIDLIANKIANSSKISCIDEWQLNYLEQLWKIQDEMISFQNKWNNTYKQWQTDYKKSKIRNIRNNQDYPDTLHLDQQILFERQNDITKDVDRLMQNIHNFAYSLKIKINNINSIISYYEKRNIFNFYFIDKKIKALILFI